ncbi:MAG TPA: hypothetical protein VGQ44_17410 [Gemmatimonadaceae bacterium]|jgi:hypothetical protein|nr:hypothetical protein [Gemmatimonadaceae bacterium]
MTTTPTPSVHVLSPSNDLVYTFVLEEVDPATFVLGPATTGAVTCFLSTSNLSNATAITGLTRPAVYIGGANGYPDGTWGVEFDADDLTPALLQPIFEVSPAPTPYLMIVRGGAVRRYITLKYQKALKAELTQV